MHPLSYQTRINHIYPIYNQPFERRLNTIKQKCIKMFRNGISVCSVYHISKETSDTDYEVVINQTVNKTMFVTEKDDATQDLDLIIVILTSLILGLMILTTVIGKLHSTFIMSWEEIFNDQIGL